MVVLTITCTIFNQIPILQHKFNRHLTISIAYTLIATCTLNFVPYSFFLSSTVESSSDNVYFAANFKSTDSMSFDISYQNVNISDAGDSVMTSRLYGWQEGDEHWLACESI